VNAYFFFGASDPRCEQAKQAIFDVLDNAGNGGLWLFGSHSDDTMWTIIAGEVVNSLVGFRTSIYDQGGLELARTGIHEGAHLMGWNEPVAQEVENGCIQLH
jgi:hypothetical protein